MHLYLAVLLPLFLFLGSSSGMKLAIERELECVCPIHTFCVKHDLIIIIPIFINSTFGVKPTSTYIHGEERVASQY